MFGWCDEDGGSRIFWFEETKAGNQKLVRPDGTYRLIKERDPNFAKLGPQGLAGWQRAKLLIREYGYWDITGVACSINTLIVVKTSRYEDDEPIVYVFSSCENAERNVYPFLPGEIVEECRKNVDAFYKNPNLQAAWHDFIIHPVCLRVKKGSDEGIPVAIDSIGCGQGALGHYEFTPLGSLQDLSWIWESYDRDEMSDNEW